MHRFHAEALGAEGRKNSPVPSWGLWLGLRIKLTREEKHTNFIEVLHIHGSLHEKMKTQRSDQSRRLLHLLDKKTVNLWRIDKTKGFGLWVVKWWRSNKVCLYSILCPGDKNVSLPPGTRRRYLSHGRFISYFQGRKAGEGGWRSEWPSCFWDFLKLLQPKIVCQCAMFWGTMFCGAVSWAPSGASE